METTKNKYQIQHEERYQEILEKAKSLFLQNDMSTVSMSDIAKACGISRQTLYKYFDGIDAIIFEIESRIMYRFSLIRAKGVDDLIDRFFEYYQRYPDDFLFICLFDLYVHTHPINAQLMEHYRQTIHQYLPDFARFFPTGNDQDVLDEIPLQKYYIVAAHTLWGLMSRMAILQQDYTEEYRITVEETQIILKKIAEKIFQDIGGGKEEL